MRGKFSAQKEIAADFSAILYIYIYTYVYSRNIQRNFSAQKEIAEGISLHKRKLQEDTHTKKEMCKQKKRKKF